MESKEKEILDTAVMLFSHKGFKAVTMTEITRHCRISKKTLYKLFPTKTSLLRMMLSQTDQLITGRLSRARSESVSAIEEFEKFSAIMFGASLIISPFLLTDIMLYYKGFYDNLRKDIDTKLGDF